MKRINIFQFLLIVAVFALILRLFSFSDISTPVSVAESTTPPKALTAIQGNKAADTASEAHKQDTEETKTDKGAEGEPKKEEDKKEVTQVGNGEPIFGEQVFSAAEIDVLQSLAKRRDELDQRDKAITEREAILKAAESEVDRKIAELDKIKGELETLLGQQEKAQEARINSLVKIYEGMKPKEAARIFDTLDMEVLLSVISRMSERKSSPILAAMDPDKARVVTIRLTEQRELPNTPAKPVPAPSAAPTAKNH